MKKTLLFTTLLLIFSSKLHAQSAQVVSLAQQITAGKKTDSLKVRAIYEWVAKNVEYDVPLFLKMKRKSIEEFIRMQQPQQVLATKKLFVWDIRYFLEICVKPLALNQNLFRV